MELRNIILELGIDKDGDTVGAEKELFILSDRISIKYNEFFKSTMKRGKESVKKDIKNIESDISALQKEISDLVIEMTKLSEAL